MANKKLTILEINKFYYLKGGSERYFFSVSELLQKHGHKIVPFAMVDKRNKESEYKNYFSSQIKLDKFNPWHTIKIFYNRDAAKRLESLIKKTKPDIAHMHNISYQLTPSIIKVLKKYHIPIIQTLHDYHLICPNYLLFNKGEVCVKCRGGKYYNCFLNNCVKNSFAKSALATMEAYFNQSARRTVDMFIAPSKFMKDVCVDFGVKENKIRVLNNFIDLNEFRDYSSALTENYLLYFGRLAPEKGIDVLLKALTRTGTKVDLLIVGAGPDKERLSALIKKNNLRDQVQMLGVKYGSELENLIANAKAVVMPSLWPENMPYTMLESLAYGKAVIAAKSGGLTEFVDDKKSGFLYNPQDSLALVEIINNLDKYNLPEIGKNARKTVKRASAEVHYDRLMSIINKLNKN